MKAPLHVSVENRKYGKSLKTIDKKEKEIVDNFILNS